MDSIRMQLQVKPDQIHNFMAQSMVSECSIGSNIVQHVGLLHKFPGEVTAEIPPRDYCRDLPQEITAEISAPEGLLQISLTSNYCIDPFQGIIAEILYNGCLQRSSQEMSAEIPYNGFLQRSPL